LTSCRGCERLRSAFAPDHFNYAFLQNQDRHVHLHVIPRYAAPREVSGVVFDDPDYPDHYAVPGRERRLSPAVFAVLAELLNGAR
jgi:diadenosine tetraphosphate (Ap4A) HIT family hydrolase